MSGASGGTQRAVPFYCPYCGDEDLRPGEEGHGTWECAACNRAFRLGFLGLLARGFAREAAPAHEGPAPRPRTSTEDPNGEGEQRT
ncbi:hypothetical protein [Streptomyces sp. SPB074]|uniref:hypothetical protein n=1 Tax=Streptomyces sp. (strain SPB074) TaxID=465543 RepID=UPI00017F14A5|nr:hypothetical protein [Streptomyces sp. SPB074]EDY46805.1 conserved hypothetical protein [Streptomyces sp. SPB074]